MNICISTITIDMYVGVKKCRTTLGIVDLIDTDQDVNLMMLRNGFQRI